MLRSTFLKRFPRFFIYTSNMDIKGCIDVRRINSSPVSTHLFRIADMWGNYGMLVVLRFESSIRIPNSECRDGDSFLT